MMKATDAMQQAMTPKQYAERLLAYREAMEPWNKQSASVIGLLMPNHIIHSDGRIETVYSEKDQAIIDGLQRTLQQISEMTLKSLGLSTPLGESSDVSDVSGKR
jgi:hypothetical protein